MEYTATITYVVRGEEEEAIGFLDLIAEYAKDSDYDAVWISESVEEREE